MLDTLPYNAVWMKATHLGYNERGAVLEVEGVRYVFPFPTEITAPSEGVRWKPGETRELKSLAGLERED